MEKWSYIVSNTIVFIFVVIINITNVAASYSIRYFITMLRSMKVLLFVQILYRLSVKLKLIWTGKTIPNRQKNLCITISLILFKFKKFVFMWSLHICMRMTCVNCVLGAGNLAIQISKPTASALLQNGSKHLYAQKETVTVSNRLYFNFNVSNTIDYF